MPPVKITSPIVAYEVVKSGEPPPATTPRLRKRPEVLEGCTYKLKPPTSDHAIYVTINHDTGDDGTRRLFEIFLESKNTEHTAWMLPLALVLTAHFRMSEDVEFIIHELKSVHDPRGGFFRPGGGYSPSIAAEIGRCIERHMRKIGQLPEEVLKVEKKGGEKGKGAICPKCGHPSLVKSEGCDTCLECGYSKCG